MHGGMNTALALLIKHILLILGMKLIHSPHLLVRATSERFLPTWGTFRAILASESHWLQLVLVFSVH
jgi:hypothetical protein